MKTGRAPNILDALRRLLDSGGFALGSRMPAERELAEQLGASRGLLRKCLSELEAEGRIWRNVGQGTFVGGRPIRSRTDLAAIGNMTNPLEVVEVRAVIEPQTAWFAAVRASEDDLRHIHHCLSKLESSPNYANYGRWDSTFHRSIAEAAHNTLLLAIFDSVNEVRNQPAWSKEWQKAIHPKKDLMGKQHKAVMNAISRRDANAAYDAMLEHIQSVDNIFRGKPRLVSSLAPSSDLRASKKRFAAHEKTNAG